MLDILTKIRGPDFKKAERIEFDLSGNKVSFLAPGYNYQMVEQSNHANMRRCYDLSDSSVYWSQKEVYEEEALIKRAKIVDGIALFKSIWQFSKPLVDLHSEPRTRNEGAIDLLVRIYKFSNIESMLVPQTLEQSILSDINMYYGPDSELGGPGKGGRRFTGPLLWTIQSLNGIQWISYFIERSGHPRCGEYFWVAPLAKKHFLSFNFRITGAPSSKLFTHYEAFMTNIISSCTINYSDEVNAQIAEVADEAAKSQLSEHVEPFAWEEYDLNPEKFKLRMSD